MLHVLIKNVQYYTTISKNVQLLFAGIQRVGRAVLHRLGQHIPARQNTATKQHHHIGLRAAVCLAHCRLCQGRQVPFSTKAAQFVDILRRLFHHGLRSFSYSCFNVSMLSVKSSKFAVFSYGSLSNASVVVY